MNKKEHPNRKDVDPSKSEDTNLDHTEVKNSGYDEAYIQALILKARKNWADVKDADEWLSEIRGYDDLLSTENTKTP